MSLKRLTIIILALFCWQITYAQQKPVKPKDIQPTNFSPEDFSPRINLATGVPLRNRTLQHTKDFKSKAISLTSANTYLRVIATDKNGLPISLEGRLSEAKQDLPLEEQVFAYLEEAKELLRIKDPGKEFLLREITTDIRGNAHVHLQQMYKGIPVFSGQLILHTQSGVITALNGRYFETPQLEDVAPVITAENATQLAYDDLAKTTNMYELSDEQKKFTDGTTTPPELVVMHQNFDGAKEHLCWKVKAIPNVLENWDYFIDAKTGEWVHKVTNTCTFYPDALRKRNPNIQHKHIGHHETEAAMPPSTGHGTDLFGVNRNFNVFLQGGNYYLIDGAREMYDAGSSIPNDARGTIITVNAQNTNPANSDFDAIYVANTNNVWNDSKAVSAHYNAGICYEYYRQKHFRNSINGQGGNIISLFNVSETDGNGMDNAFWNGQAMFYGNGAQAFDQPLQKALDVAGHEMTHGVIQSTAGLLYENQAGAINESMADVFGYLMEPNDWTLGEDVVNNAIFSSGALRDLSDPNQGGTGLNDAGWQPAHMNEYQDLPNTPQGDNGGVHINSGIPNKAFYLFASAVGNQKAEAIYYHALTNNLTANSQFIDLRLAIINSANQLYSSAEATAAANAFDQVGIFGGTGSEDPTDYTSNPGEDFILTTDEDKSSLYIYDGSNVYGLTNDPILSRPSVTDDGAYILYVAADNTIRILTYHSDTQAYTEDYLENNPQTIWRNVAVSKDGTKLAALTTDFDNYIFVYDFNTQMGQDIEVRNSTSQQGVFTNDLQYVDFIEWDFVGEEILFDAYNVLDDDFGNTSDYWDVGLIRAWDNAANTFGDGYVFKIFNGLPENTSVGNPSFSKNSPYIMTLDFIENGVSSSDVSILGVNIQTGEVGTIYEHSILGYPNYSIDDTGMIFDAEDLDGNQVLGYIALANDKITADGSGQVFLSGGKWGVWYGLGERDLTSAQDRQVGNMEVILYPNPTTGLTALQVDVKQAGKANITVFDLTGKALFQQKELLFAGKNNSTIDLSQLTPGLYTVRIETAEGIGIRKIIVE